MLLYYCLAIKSALAHATQLSQHAADRLLAYFRNYPDNILVLKACNTRLHLHSDSSFGTRSHGRPVADGIAYLGNEDPTEINVPILVHIIDNKRKNRKSFYSRFCLID